MFALPANVGQPTGDGNLQLLRDGAILVRDPWELLEEYACQFPEAVSRQDCSGWDSAVGLPRETTEMPEKPAVKPLSSAKKPVDKAENRNYIDAKKIMDTLTTDEQRVVSVLEAGPVHIDVLSEQLQQPAGCVLALLTMLEVKGVVKSLPGRRVALKEQNH